MTNSSSPSVRDPDAHGTPTASLRFTMPMTRTSTAVCCDN